MNDPGRVLWRLVGRGTLVGVALLLATDAGPGSLRQATGDAGAHPGIAAIRFAPGACNPLPPGARFVCT